MAVLVSQGRVAKHSPLGEAHRVIGSRVWADTKATTRLLNDVPRFGRIPAYQISACTDDCSDSDPFWFYFVDDPVVLKNKLAKILPVILRDNPANPWKSAKLLYSLKYFLGEGGSVVLRILCDVFHNRFQISNSAIRPDYLDHLAILC